MKDCDQRPRLDAYHDGELDAVERAELERHLPGCPRCNAEFEAMGRMSVFFGAPDGSKVSDAELSQLAKAVRANPSALALGRLFTQTLVAAAVVLASGVATSVYLGRRTGAAAHEAMVLDFATTPTHTQGGTRAIGPVAGVVDESQAQLAQWIVDDLNAGREVTR